MVGWCQSLKYQPNFRSLESFTATLLFLYPLFRVECLLNFSPLRRHDRGCLICQGFNPNESTHEYSQPYSGLSIPSTAWPYRRPITPMGFLTAFEDVSLEDPVSSQTRDSHVVTVFQPAHSLTKDLTYQFHFHAHTSAVTEDSKLCQFKAANIIQVNSNSAVR